jgi:hypothetical protein
MAAQTAQAIALALANNAQRVGITLNRHAMFINGNNSGLRALG